MNPYIGHPQQLYGVTELRLSGGKGDGMRMLEVRNGSGLAFMISADRCADIARLSFKGDNFSYISPCGYVSPQYYDNRGAGFLKSFTAGFITTCGLTAVGTPCTDDGEELPLHGTISNTPCESISHWIEKDAIHIKAIIRDAAPFAHKLILEREYVCPLFENVIYMTDRIQNIGSEDCPLEVLYHCNMGYPLLSEEAKLTIPATEIAPRDEHAATGLDTCLTVEKPRRGYQEMCFYHKLSGKPTVSLYNPVLGKGLELSYDTAELKFFTQWKMMGDGEYVMGLEPGNCTPDGRAAMRQSGQLEFLTPDAVKEHHLCFRFTEDA